MKPGDYHEKWYVDTTTGYITRRDIIEKEGTETQDFSDFRPVDGVPLPFKATVHGSGDQELDITSIQNNVAVDDKMFSKKEEKKN
jgi:hypothetical protein